MKIFLTIILSTLVLFFNSSHGFAQSHDSKLLLEQLGNPEIKLSEIRDEFNDRFDALERGKIFLNVASELFTDAPTKNTLKQNFSWIACQTDNWELQEQEAKNLEKIFFAYAIQLADDKEKRYRFAVCAAVNKVNFYFGKITEHDLNTRNQVCEGKYEETLDLLSPAKIIKNETAFINHIETNWKSSERYSFYPLRTKIRMAQHYAQLAVASEIPQDRSKSLKKAVEVISNIIVDPSKLSKTRNGWRFYNELLVHKLIYEAWLNEPGTHSREIIKYFANNAHVNRIVKVKDTEKVIIGHWPSIYEIHSRSMGHLIGNNIKGLFGNLEILNSELSRWDEYGGIPSNFVDMVYIERLFPFAQTNSEDECKGWNRRLYNPNLIMQKANQCLVKSTLIKFDSCMSEIEESDWRLRFATLRHEEDNQENANILSENLNKALDKNVFWDFFKNKNRTVLALPLDNNSKQYEVFVEPRNFSTQEVTRLKELFNDAGFFKRLKLPRPLFSRPKQY